MKALEDRRFRGKQLARARGAFCSLAMLMLSISHSQAGEWTVLPRLRLSETYTDNVRLGTGGFRGGGGEDFVTQINPGMVIRGGGNSLQSQCGLQHE